MDNEIGEVLRYPQPRSGGDAMNWDAIGAIGQMLGSLAVFVSLVYLGVQTRHSRIATQHASQNALVADYDQMLAHLYTNKDLVDAIHRSFHATDLSVLELERLHAFAGVQHIQSFNIYLLMEAGQFDPRLGMPFIRLYASIVRSAGFRHFWENIKVVQRESPFLDYIDALDVPPLSTLQPWWLKPYTGSA
jgi:hypothetical protein